MTQIPFESFNDCLLDAQMEVDCADEMETDEDLLVKKLQLSHQKVLEGKIYSQTEVELYLDERLQHSELFS